MGPGGKAQFHVAVAQVGLRHVRTGTPGFVGARLSEAREARGLTATQLGELTGVSSTSISQYEKGKTTPAPRNLNLLANVLNLPEHFFLLPDRDYARGTVF